MGHTAITPPAAHFTACRRHFPNPLPAPFAAVPDTVPVPTAPSVSRTRPPTTPLAPNLSLPLPYTLPAAVPPQLPYPAALPTTYCSSPHLMGLLFLYAFYHKQQCRLRTYTAYASTYHQRFFARFEHAATHLPPPGKCGRATPFAQRAPIPTAGSHTASVSAFHQHRCLYTSPYRNVLTPFPTLIPLTWFARSTTAPAHPPTARDLRYPRAPAHTFTPHAHDCVAHGVTAARSPPASHSWVRVQVVRMDIHCHGWFGAGLPGFPRMTLLLNVDSPRHLRLDWEDNAARFPVAGAYLSQPAAAYTTTHPPTPPTLPAAPHTAQHPGRGVTRRCCRAAHHAAHLQPFCDGRCLPRDALPPDTRFVTIPTPVLPAPIA